MDTNYYRDYLNSYNLLDEKLSIEAPSGPPAKANNMCYDSLDEKISLTKSDQLDDIDTRNLYVKLHKRLSEQSEKVINQETYRLLLDTAFSLMDPGLPAFMISGTPGTGKSHLITELILSAWNEVTKKTLEQTVQCYDDSGKLILYDRTIEIPKREITLPSKEILTDVSVIQGTLLNRVQNDPDMVHTLTAREFEEMVAEAYESLGYKVELTKMTRDGGKDIILYADGPTGHNMYYVECKHKPKRPVDVGLVRNLYGVVEADRATAGILVTSSTFTPDAKAFERNVCHRMTLLDYLELLSAVAKHQNMGRYH